LIGSKFIDYFLIECRSGNCIYLLTLNSTEKPRIVKSDVSKHIEIRLNRFLHA